MYFCELSEGIPIHLNNMKFNQLFKSWDISGIEESQFSDLKKLYVNKSKPAITYWQRIFYVLNQKKPDSSFNPIGVFLKREIYENKTQSFYSLEPKKGYIHLFDKLFELKPHDIDISLKFISQKDMDQNFANRHIDLFTFVNILNIDSSFMKNSNQESIKELAKDFLDKKLLNIFNNFVKIENSVIKDYDFTIQIDNKHNRPLILEIKCNCSVLHIQESSEYLKFVELYKLFDGKE